MTDMKRIVFAFVAFVVLIALASCSFAENNEKDYDFYYEGYDDGYATGYDVGYDDGCEDAKGIYGYNCLRALDIVDQAMAIIDDIEYYSLDDVYDKLIKARDVLSEN